MLTSGGLSPAPSEEFGVEWAMMRRFVELAGGKGKKQKEAKKNSPAAECCP